MAAFIPAGTPLGLMPLMILLEILAYTTRTLSLGLRLAVNLITGHILAKVVVGFLWIGVGAINTNLSSGSMVASLSSVAGFMVGFLAISLFLGLEILIAYLQAYIFTFIICITFKDIASLGVQ